MDDGHLPDHGGAMKIEQWQQCHDLPKGQLVTDAVGEVWRVSKHDGDTWLEPFSDEYATVIKPDGSVPEQWDDDPKLPLTVVSTVPVGSRGELDEYIAAIVSGDWARLSQLRDRLLQPDEEGHS